LFDKIYKNKIILIIGHNHFKGSLLAICPKELDAPVIAYSVHPPKQTNNYEVTKLREKKTHNHERLL